MANVDPSKLTPLISLLIASFELFGNAIKFGSKVKRGFSNEGIYKVLDYQSTLEIFDSLGKNAIFKKKMVIKYLQDNVNTFTDFGWSDGKGLLKYQVSPGQPVDQYKSGPTLHPRGFSRECAFAFQEIRDCRRPRSGRPP